MSIKLLLVLLVIGLLVIGSVWVVNGVARAAFNAKGLADYWQARSDEALGSQAVRIVALDESIMSQGG